MNLLRIVSQGWNTFLYTYLNQWLTLIENWILRQSRNNSNKVLVVKYEDLKQDTLKEIGRMMTFLGLPFDKEVVAHRLAEDFTDFKQPHNAGSDFEHYRFDQIMRVKDAVLRAIRLTEKSNMTHVLDLTDYLNRIESFL